MKVRKTKKASNTQTAFKNFENEFNKTDKTINEILELCTTRDWKGFQADWIKNINNNFNNVGNGKQKQLDGTDRDNKKLDWLKG